MSVHVEKRSPYSYYTSYVECSDAYSHAEPCNTYSHAEGYHHRRVEMKDHRRLIDKVEVKIPNIEEEIPWSV